MKRLLIVLMLVSPFSFPLQLDTNTQINKVVRGDSFVQFPDGGKIWLCGLMADGTIDASLDVIAEEAIVTAIVNGADPRNVYVDHRL